MNVLVFVTSLLVMGLVQASVPAPDTLSENALFQDLLKQVTAAAVVDTAGLESEGAEDMSRERRRVNQTVESPLDILIDYFLGNVMPQIISHGKPVLPLPDFNLHFNTSLGNTFRVVGALSCRGGQLQDVKSLFRAGPSVLRRGAGGALLLEASAGLRKLSLSFSKYSVSLNGPLAAGQAQMELSPATMSARLLLIPPCTVQLQQLAVPQLGKLQVKITGLPPSLSGLPQLLESLFDMPDTRQHIVAIVVAHASEMIAQKLKNLSCK